MVGLSCPGERPLQVLCGSLSSAGSSPRPQTGSPRPTHSLTTHSPLAVACRRASAIRRQCVPRQKTCRQPLHSQYLSSQASVRGGTRAPTCSLGSSTNSPPQAMQRGSRSGSCSFSRMCPSCSRAPRPIGTKRAGCTRSRITENWKILVSEDRSVRPSSRAWLIRSWSPMPTRQVAS